MIGSVAPQFGLACLALLLLARNWAGWTDPLVDFGRELYVPWQLAAGQVLYRDIAYLDGPFSPYWNALWFAAFPATLRTLEVSNIAIIAAASTLVFALLQRMIGSDERGPIGRRVVAAAGVGFFLCVFAVNLIGTGGNMNWVAPYSHGITHGVALSLLSVWCFARHLERGHTIDLALAGGALGLCALTKPEVFAAAALAIGVGMLASFRTPPTGADAPTRRFALLFACALAPGAVAVGLLALAMPFQDALAGALGGWSHLAVSEVQSLHFYQWVMGIDEPIANLMQMGLAAGVWAALLVPSLIGSIALSNSAIRTGAAITLGAMMFAIAPWAAEWYAWGDVLRPMVVFLAASTLWAAATVWRLRADPADLAASGPPAITTLVMSVLGVALLAKIFAKPILDGYAFALAVPGAIVLVFCLLHAVPVSIGRSGGDGRLFGRVALVALAMISLCCLLVSEPTRSAKDIVVGSGGDRFVAGAERRARVANNLIRWIDKRLPADATLLVLPEGVMINYLTRRTNPTRHLNFLPPELAIFDERAILADLEAHPPDFVALVQRDTAEYGLPLFGTHYAESLLEWAHENFVLIVRDGAEPLAPERMNDRLNGWEVRARRVDPRGGQPDVH